MQTQINGKANPVTKPIYPVLSHDLVSERQSLAPDIEAAFKNFNAQVFKDGALPGKIKQLIAVAAAHVTQCPYCISSHTKAALRYGATKQELMEAVWVAAEMRAGAAYTHSAIMLDALGEQIPQG